MIAGEGRDGVADGGADPIEEVVDEALGVPALLDNGTLAVDPRLARRLEGVERHHAVLVVGDEVTLAVGRAHGRQDRHRGDPPETAGGRERVAVRQGALLLHEQHVLGAGVPALVDHVPDVDQATDLLMNPPVGVDAQPRAVGEPVGELRGVEGVVRGLHHDLRFISAADFKVVAHG